MNKLILWMVLLVSILNARTLPTEINWPMKVISWDVDKAHPNVLYEHRLAIHGGLFPYYYKLTTAPTGMSISDNGTIEWTPQDESTGNTVTVQIIDSKNDLSYDLPS